MASVFGLGSLCIAAVVQREEKIDHFSLLVYLGNRLCSARAKQLIRVLFLESLQQGKLYIKLMRSSLFERYARFRVRHIDIAEVAEHV